MDTRILCVTATAIEVDSFKKINGLEARSSGYRYGRFDIEFLVTGVGTSATIYGISKWLSCNKTPDLVINAGIAGSFNPLIEIGDVVMPVSDCFADAGIEDGGSFFTLSEAGITSGNEYPFKNDFIYCENSFCKKLTSIVKPVKALTVNTSTGSELTKNRLMAKFNADIETMEGAAFFYVCSLEKVPFVALRAVSNMVEKRDKSKWNIPLALNNLTIKLTEILETL